MNAGSRAVTGLAWPASPLPETLAWPSAAPACESLQLAGFSDYRLPTRIELLSIVRYSAAAPKSPPLFDTPLQPSWTASAYAKDRTRAWAVDFRSGDSNAESKEEPLAVRCVRGGRSVPNRPSDRFVSESGSVFDRVTQLTWQQDAAGPFDAAGARDYCRTLTIVASGGFRVPALHELHTLVDETTASPALPAGLFLDEAGRELWSATDNGAASFAYALDTRDGHSLSIEPSASSYFVRCVR